MCLAFMQSEHMKKLLFTIHPPLLLSLDAGRRETAAAGEVAVGGEEGPAGIWQWPAGATPGPGLGQL
jgi:hypothetical protein